MNDLFSKLDTAEVEGEFEEITQNTADNKLRDGNMKEVKRSEG